MFWSTEPPSDEQRDLLRATLLAHHLSAQRPNASSAAVANSAAASGDYAKAMASGLMTIGGAHGPIVATYQTIFERDDTPQGIVPGWGSSFPLPDPIWEEVETMIRAHRPDVAARLDRITADLAARGKPILPNPSAFTACAAHILGCPKHAAPFLFLAGRLEAWSEIFSRHARPR